MSVHLRQATTDDHALCLQLLHDADEDDISTLAVMTDPASTTYIAYDDTTPVGAAVMHWDKAEVELTHLAVTNTLRGRGIGKQIIAALISESRARQMQSVIVGTANSSLGNIAFYQKCGFRMDHVRHDYFSYFTQPVSENGIPVRDMIVFRMTLD